MKLPFLFTLAILYLLLRVMTVNAQQPMSNGDYIIRTNSLNTVSESVSDLGYKANPTPTNLGPIISEGVNYKIMTGFENLKTTLSFSVSISSDIIDFGILSPTNPIIRTVDLSTNTQGTYGYSVIVFEDQPLTASSSGIKKTFIPDTTCDKGTCGVETSAVWTNALTYGFGYRCDDLISISCDNSFTQPNFYRHFPDIINNDDPQSIISAEGADNQQARISYKVNTSGNQSKGNYGNTVTYIGIPNF